MLKTIVLRIILEAPTPGVVYGLQKGKTSNHDISNSQRSNSGDLCFQFYANAQLFDTDVVVRSPYIQGSKDRFVYINIGTYAGQKDSIWSRRLKVPLTGIDSSMLNALSDSEILECKVPGAGKDGTPNCATVKPFSGWKIISTH